MLVPPGVERWIVSLKGLDLTDELGLGIWCVFRIRCSRAAADRSFGLSASWCSNLVDEVVHVGDGRFVVSTCWGSR